MSSLWLVIAHWGVGLIPGPRGTYGSALAAVVFAVVTWLWPPGGWVFFAAAAVLGTIAAAKAEAVYGPDASQIVVDEVAGQALTLLFFSAAWWAYPAGFLLFRLFDIVKPWPAGAAERLPGGWGVMADDLAAGLQAGACLWVLAAMLA